ncbi:hypothetical protein pipiens_012489 [Culex pipiens pipiens]|uniref:BTB domain-containing protein n=1 Tax=Culex pipiens pipiens TaxID=38569 RepID=A0ABD1D257_CULPP
MIVLLAGQRFVDVTLACEGHQVHCHRLVLAACSTFFENLLGENPCKHPIIILPREIKLWAIQALVDFMYKGEVNVSQNGLPDLMKCAEILKIRGLCGSDAALNLNQVTSPGGGSTSSSSNSGSSNAGNSSAQQRESSNQSGQRGTSPQRMEQGKGQQNSALSGTTTKTGGIFLETLNTNPVASSTPTKVPSQQQLQQQQNLHQSGDDGDNSDNGGSGSEMCIKTEDLIIDEDVGKGGDDEEELEMDGNDKLQADDDDEDIEEYIENVDQFGEEPQNSNGDSTNNEFTITITDENSTGSQKATSEARPPKAKPTSTSPPQSSSSSLLSLLTRGSIRVKSNENLFENYKHQQDHKEENKSASQKHVYSQYGDDGGGGTGLPSSLVYNRNTMDIYVKPKKGGTSTASNPDVSLEDPGSDTSADGYENIICSPNFPQLSRSSMMSFQDDDYDDDFDIQILPDDSSMTNGDSDTGGDDDLVYPPPLLPFGNSETSITRVPSGKSNRSYGGPGLSTSRKSSGRGGKSGTRQPREIKPAVANGVAIAPSAFILRNPRGNQPRSYNTDALWKALMDVKAGESIYRASQIHKVPRKTLRNWMKRWDIKSAYPMPRQLKEAAEKKRIIKELTEQAQQLSDELTTH